MKRILVANRGEIAVRVIKTATEMGIETIAIYSNADAGALFTLLATKAVPLESNELAETYLDEKKIIQIAQEHQCDALHPGYGFLSERDSFSESCQAAGITFIGPSGSAMRRLGAKIDAKQLALEQNVPITPGFFEQGASLSQLKEAAEKIGYPVMLKASAGGGGRGMRVVHSADEFDQACQLAQTEALNAFGDDAMMVEKFVDNPRHIEVQFIADVHGNVAPLFERECSIQRRHQKLIEESPSPYFLENAERWSLLAEATRKLATASGYVGAGTVEFMLDSTSDEFYFLEVNARLQVEHPVTEAITGLDLVRLQIEVAKRKNLLELIPEFLAGDRRQIRGHAIEMRIVAEDPQKGFLPSIGKIVGWAMPQGPGIRVDTGLGCGDEITPLYDSMIAKVIVHGPTRQAALERAKSALLDCHILGIKSNGFLLYEILHTTDFIAGLAGTKFVDEWLAKCSWNNSYECLFELVSKASVAQFNTEPNQKTAQSAWGLRDGFKTYKNL